MVCEFPGRLFTTSTIAITGLNRSASNSQDFGQLTIDLMAIIENRDSIDSGR
jgi:hypothetical protein